MPEVSTHMQNSLTVILACSRSTKDEMMGSALTPSIMLCMIPAHRAGRPSSASDTACAAPNNNRWQAPAPAQRRKSLVQHKPVYYAADFSVTPPCSLRAPTGSKPVLGQRSTCARGVSSHGYQRRPQTHRSQRSNHSQQHNLPGASLLARAVLYRAGPYAVELSTRAWPRYLRCTLRRVM